MGKKKNRQVVFHFCYPKPPKGLNSPQGMLSITEQHPLDSNKFKNHSIDMSRGMFQGLSQELGNKEGEELTCEQYDKVFICLDVFDIQLPYEANVRGILKVMRDEFPKLYDEYIALTKLKYEALDYVLQLDGQSLKGTPVVAWGDVPYEACLRGNQALGWSFKKVHNVKLNCHSIHKVNHPCSFIDLRHCAIKKERYKSNDVSLTIASNHIAGHMLQSGQGIEETWCIDFYHRKTPQIEARRRRLVTLAANPSITQQDQRNEFAKRSRTAGKKLKAGTHDDPFVESKISFTNKVRAAAKKKRDGIVDEHDPFLTNLKTQGDALANSSKSASKTWQEGKIDPMNPQHKSWMNTGSRITEKHTITFMKKFEKQVQDWIPQRHLNWSAISRKTRKWMGHVRECNNGKRNSLTDAQNQLLLKLNFPFYPYLDKRNSEYKRLQEFQRENGPKSIPSSATWQEGVRDPITHPVHKVWMNTDSRISEKHIITYTKKFEKQVQDWWKQKDSDAISPETTAWMRNIRQRNKGNGQHNPLTAAEYQLLLKLKFPFNPRLEVWNSEFKKLLEFQAENGAKSIPSSVKKNNKYYSLYKWCLNTRVSARRNTLSEEQMDKLKSALGNWIN